MMKRAIALLLILIFYGCATPYQKNGLRGGYSETRLSEEMFEVSYWANEETTVEKIDDFTLLRSAELTLGHGYKFFIIGDSDSNSAYMSSSSKVPRKKVLIACLKELPEDGTKGFFPYDAGFIRKSIREKYNIS